MSENMKSRLIKEQKRCQSIQLNYRASIRRGVTFSKVDFSTQVEPLENRVFGCDRMVHLHRHYQEPSLLQHGQVYILKERWQLHRMVPSQCNWRMDSSNTGVLGCLMQKSQKPAILIEEFYVNDQISHLEQ